ncbi:hypothetical protein R1flu_002264 [Riccia fluitans]|uniref:Uncharacterized protein n=1 Tax=Riccia fluitans TaxID=41844 RepID=A0ABD1Y6M1_9MARC
MEQKEAAGAGGIVTTGGPMELSILKLGSPRKRFASAQFSFDFESSSNPGTPPSARKATISPFAGTSDEDDEMVFEQHRAAIPFVWEEKPGTPRGVSSVITKPEIPPKLGEGTLRSEDAESDALAALVNPSTELLRQEMEVDKSSPSTNSDFEFRSSTGSAARVKSSSNSQTSRTADELFSQGRIVPLKPPPRLLSVKQLMAADAAAEDAATTLINSPGTKTPGHSFRKDGLRTPTRSFRKDGLKALIAPSPRRERPEELVTTMLGFEEWQPKDQSRKDGTGHRRASSLSILPTLFRKKSGPGKETGNDGFDGDASVRKSGLVPGTSDREPFDSVSSRTLGGGKDDIFVSSQNSRFDIDARSDYFNTSGRTIPEEDPEDREDGDEEAVEAETASKKKQGRLSRFFSKKPSRLSAVAPSPSPEELQVKRVQPTSPLLKMCLSNGLGQALVRGVKHFRSMDSQPHVSGSR